MWRDAVWKYRGLFFFLFNNYRIVHLSLFSMFVTSPRLSVVHLQHGLVSASGVSTVVLQHPLHCACMLGDKKRSIVHPITVGKIAKIRSVDPVSWYGVEKIFGMCCGYSFVLCNNVTNSVDAITRASRHVRRSLCNGVVFEHQMILSYARPECPKREVW